MNILPHSNMRHGKYFRGRGIEEYGYVLDFFEAERSIKVRRIDGTTKSVRIFGLIGQVLGENCFYLMEFQLDPRVSIKHLDRINVGRQRPAMLRFLSFISYNDLTEKAKENLVSAIERAILASEKMWVNFLNNAGPITIKVHSLELLGAIGKKRIIKIIEEREKEPFKSFRNFYERTGINPIKAIAERVLEELMGEQEYYIVVCLGHEKRY
ncbi:MAG: DUF655 domain-containing protein [Candidatus Geothermarchaeota archaeon]